MKEEIQNLSEEVLEIEYEQIFLLHHGDLIPKE